MSELNIPPSVTEDALAQIQDIGGECAILRVAVDGGGCSGFQYRIEMGKIEDGDLILGNEQAKVVIDPISLPFLQGAKIDYKNELIGSRFVIDNPNTASECGCGTSFSI